MAQKGKQMITQCPECKKQHPISAVELRSSNAKFYCDQCEQNFDALEFLKDSPPEEKQSKDLLVTQNEINSKSSVFWKFGFSACVALIIFQTYYFEAYNLSQNKTLRPWLEKACVRFECTLPTYKDLDDFSIIHGSFELTEDKAYYIFKTAFINQSFFKQHHPAIKLTLQNFTGHDFAERIFRPQDYLEQNLNFINPDKSVEISMKIAVPPTEIGGYRFELI